MRLFNTGVGDMFGVVIAKHFSLDLRKSWRDNKAKREEKMNNLG